MRVLVVGAGVIGTVYGAQLGAAGHTIGVLAHGSRTDAVEAHGLRARDVVDGRSVITEAAVVATSDEMAADVVLVAVRRDQLAAAAQALLVAPGRPLMLFFANNPAGRAGLPPDLPGEVALGFPGVGGAMAEGVAAYARIPRQPTALPAGADPRLAELEAALATRGLAVQRVGDMDGWLAYHALFVACVSAALYRCEADPARLACDRATLRLMSRAITEGFAALRAEGVVGLPGNLATLHHPLLAPVAQRYWARTMRSPMGELCFAAHARHAEPEMRRLGRDVTERLGERRGLADLRMLLEEPATSGAGSGHGRT